MNNKIILICAAAITGLIWLLLGVSCEKVEMVRKLDMDDYTGLMSDSLIMEESKLDDESGISFEMESDSLQDEVEEINLGAKDWDEECMDVDL